MRPKLNKWYPLRTRFRVVKAHIKEKEGSDNQYRLVIEFPREHRSGWYPFELQLRDGGDSHGLTNYWVNPFAESEIIEVIDALQTIAAQNHNLSRLLVIKRKHELKEAERRWANRKPKPTAQREGTATR